VQPRWTQFARATLQRCETACILVAVFVSSLILKIRATHSKISVLRVALFGMRHAITRLWVFPQDRCFGRASKWLPGTLHAMLRPLASVLLMSVVAAAQATMQVRVSRSDSCISSKWLNQSLVDGMLADDVFTPLSPGFDDCLREDQIPNSPTRKSACLAQTASSNLPGVPSAQAYPENKDNNRDSSPTRSVSQSLAQAGATNSTKGTLDRKFILLQTFSTAALVADLETTAHVFAGRQPKAIELDPLFGQHPTRVRLYGIGVPLDAFIFYMSYHAKKVAPNRRLWELGPGLSIAVHSAAAINNLIVAHQ
jgi:hypothetical protein